MSDRQSIERRRFLKLLGGGAVLMGMVACGKETASSPPMADPAPAPSPGPDPAPPQPPAPPVDAGAGPPSSTPTGGAGGDLPKLSPDDPQARALAYVHDATSVDKSAQPRYEPGQACRNCALYTGGDQPWGPCGIFPGKAVNASGWCSAYAPKPS